MKTPVWTHPVCWIALAGLILAADYLTGPLIQFPVLYLLPITLTAWYHGRRSSLALAFTMAAVRLYFSVLWSVHWGMLTAAINTLIQFVVFAGFAMLVARVATQKRALETEVDVLRGILPICSFCKKIRNESGDWEVLEQYLTTHSAAEFSHGLCPDCARKHYPDFFDQ